MEPIISPWLIYLLGVAEGLGVVVGVALIVCACTALGIGMFGYIEDDIESHRPSLRRWIIWTAVFAVAAIFIPSRSTIVGMIIAKNITPDNVKVAVQTGKDLHDALKKDVLDIIEAVKKEEKK